MLGPLLIIVGPTALWIAIAFFMWGGPYDALIWRYGPKSPGDTLVAAAVLLLDSQPLAWHEVAYDRLAHPEGFAVSRHELVYNQVRFQITNRAESRLSNGLQRRKDYLQRYAEAQALGAEAPHG